MDPALSLRSIENALRLAVVAVLGEQWHACPGAPNLDELKEKRDDERRRRDGVATSSDLIEFTEFYNLQNIIIKNWQQFKAVFNNQARLKIYLEIVSDVRNSIAHSRNITIFERDLLSGISGQIRAQVAQYRSEMDQSSRYYPLIEECSDSFGNQGLGSAYRLESTFGRLDVGDIIKFRASAFTSRDADLIWQLHVEGNEFKGITGIFDESKSEVARGTDVEFKYRIKKENVGEWIIFKLVLTTDKKYHRYHDLDSSFDDEKEFVYSINPPLDD